MPVSNGPPIESFDSSAAALSPPMDTRKLLEFLEEAVQESLVEGTSMFLLSDQWLRRCQKWCQLHPPGTAVLADGNTSNHTTNGIDSPRTHHVMDSASSGNHPGPIDNQLLLKEEQDDPSTAAPLLKEGLVEQTDYWLLSEEAWTTVVQLFGLKQGQRDILRRPVILEASALAPRPIVEIYPQAYFAWTLAASTPNATQAASLHHAAAEKRVEISRKSTLQQLFLQACATLGLPADPERVRMWAGPVRDVYSQYRVYEVVAESEQSKSIDASPISQDRYLMLEWRESANVAWPVDQGTLSAISGVHNENASPSRDSPESPDEELPAYSSLWSGKREETTTAYTGIGLSSSPLDSSSSRFGIRSLLDRPRVKRTAGLTGLMNLGNTCFMNSAIQCLSNTRPLLDYFLSDRYKQEINKSNPLGMGGEMAEAFGKLLHAMWSQTESAVAPRDVKFTISRFAPQFSGYQQHDSQELTGFLLDALHEDLNRIQKKPYIEFPDSNDDTPQEEFAETVWNIHKARNDSIIVDCLQGQLRSTLVCPECEKVSVTFDPFMYCSLPLPIDKKVLFRFTLVPLDTHREKEKHLWMVSGDFTIGQAKKMIGERMGMDPSKLRIADVFSYKVYKTFADSESVREIGANDDIYVYEIGAVDPISSKRPRMVMDDGMGFHGSSLSSTDALQQEEVAPHELVNIYALLSNPTGQLFGSPMVATVRSSASLSDLYTALLHQLRRYTSIDVLTTKPSDFRADGTQLEPAQEDDDLDRVLGNSPGSSSSSTAGITEQWFVIAAAGEESMGGWNSAGRQKSLAPNQDGVVVVKPGTTLQLMFTDHCKNVLFGPDTSRFMKYKEGVVEREKPMAQVNLDACFDEFSKSEQLGEDDAWYCPRCKKHQQASKKLELWKLPEILIIHLKRFSHSRYRRDKIEALVDFPLTGLDMTERVLGPQSREATAASDGGRLLYDLYAISNHFGGLGGGHYTAFAKNKVDGRWHDFDDSSVTDMDANSVKKPAAYVLYYQRRREGQEQLEESFTTPQMSPVSESPFSRHVSPILPLANGGTMGPATLMHDLTAAESADEMASDADSIVVNVMEDGPREPLLFGDPMEEE